MTLALELAEWAHGFTPTDDDLALAERALTDTVAVAIAAIGEPVIDYAAVLSEAAQWAVAAHALAFDDLHMASTAHVSSVVMSTVLGAGGTLRDYLAGAGVMTRIGPMLGWQHYEQGWHATCTAGAPAAAVAAGMSRGLDVEELAHAIVLAVPAAGGIQRAFASDGKPLQVGYVVDAGLRAAELAACGARGDLRTLDAWLEIVGGSRRPIEPAPAVPGGLAVKLHPCCYAMQRLIGAVREHLSDVEPDAVERVVITTPESSLQPLKYHRPVETREAKFSAEYAIAAALLDGFPGFSSFTNAAVNRPEAQDLVARVVTNPLPGGVGLLAGDVELTVRLKDGTERHAVQALPSGAPDRPATVGEMAQKAAACGEGLDSVLQGIDLPGAAALLRSRIARPDLVGDPA